MATPARVTTAAPVIVTAARRLAEVPAAPWRHTAHKWDDPV